MQALVGFREQPHSISTPNPSLAKLAKRSTGMPGYAVGWNTMHAVAMLLINTEDESSPFWASLRPKEPVLSIV
jgi:hypothetical protein